jgi:SOS-response transcriptional repressor LexA
MELKDWIRAARVKAELTQEKLGELLGVSKGNVSAWENDRHEPSYAQLQQISEIAGMALPVTEHKHESGMRDASISVAKEGLFKGIPTDAKHSIDGSNITPGRGFHGKIPLISWDQARTWDQLVKNFAHDDAEHWLDCPVPHGSRSYSVQNISDSMDDGTPDGYREGEILFVDPDVTAALGDDVIVELADGKMLFKRLKEDTEGPYLLGLNGKKIMRMPEGATVRGVVIFSGVFRRRQ